MVGAAVGHHVTILMSSGASEERRRLIRQLGAELILFDSAGQYQTGIEISRKMAAEDPRYFLPRQFENPLNVEDHERTPLADVVAAIARHAPIAEAELVGLAPAAAFDGFPDDIPVRNRRTIEEVVGSN